MSEFMNKDEIHYEIIEDMWHECPLDDGFYWYKGDIFQIYRYEWKYNAGIDVNGVLFNAHLYRNWEMLAMGRDDFYKFKLFEMLKCGKFIKIDEPTNLYG